MSGSSTQEQRVEVAHETVPGVLLAKLDEFSSRLRGGGCWTADGGRRLRAILGVWQGERPLLCLSASACDGAPSATDGEPAYGRRMQAATVAVGFSAWGHPFAARSLASHALGRGGGSSGARD
jgi:hypothetical protein